MALALLVLPASAGLAQSVPAGTAKNAVGVLVVVRTDGVEARLQGRGAVRVFEGDVLRVEGQGKAFIEMDERIQMALNGDSVVQVLSRWEKEHGLTRVLRLRRGEVWARIVDARRAVEIETPVGVLAARAAEVNMRLVSESEAVATVVTGTGEFSTPFATCALRAGTTSFGHRSKACTPPAVTDVRTVIGWSRPLLP
ncbi:MAG: FecR domain-containing protein [Candidatus Rokuibacteriota bacterium]